MNQHSMTSGAICLALAFAVSVGPAFAAAPEPKPVVTWQAGENDKGVAFDGAKTQVALKDGAKLYNPADGFAVSVRIKPEGFARLAGIVSHYHGSRTGGWYLALSPNPPHDRLWVVAIARGPKYVALTSSNRLEPGKWYHVTLNFDGKELALLCDGKVVARAKTGGPLLARPAPFLIGRRKRASLKGQMRDLRLYDQPLKVKASPSAPAAPKSPAPKARAPMRIRNYLRNSSFELGSRLCEMLAWHRMTGTQCLPSPQPGWEVVRGQAFHGKQCLKGDGTRPLWIPAEVWAAIPRKSPWTFSVYLRSERDGAPCELRFSAYIRLKQEYRARKVTLTQNWKRYELTVRDLFGKKTRHGRELGPVNFWIRPLAKGAVWADAAQWQPGAAATAYTPGLRDQPLASAEFKLLKPPSIPARESVGKTAKQARGEVPILVYHEGSRPVKNAPVQLGAPFAAGVWNGAGSLALLTDSGKLLDAQSEILSRRRNDLSDRLQQRQERQQGKPAPEPGGIDEEKA